MNESGELHNHRRESDGEHQKPVNRPLLEAILNAILPEDKDKT
jgi:hypothetical protein